MPRRDPETGKFVSSKSDVSETWRESDQIVTQMHLSIPAADLSGGTSTFTFENDNDLAIADFGEVVDNDEVFELVEGRYDLYLSMHTTATAEAMVGAGWTISPDLEGPQVGQIDPPHFSGSSASIGGTVVNRTRSAIEENDNLLEGGYLIAENSHSDTTNGLAAGSDKDRERKHVRYTDPWGGGPMYDSDDELYLTGEFHVDNASDIAVHLGCQALLRGVVHEVDC